MISANILLSLSGVIASLIVDIPAMSTANPTMILPIFAFFVLFLRIMNITPMSARTGAKDDGLSSCRKKLLLLMPVIDRSHAVTVVPTLAPRITLIAC